MAGLEHLVNLFVARYGLLALFALLAVEEMGVWLPLPGDLLIVYFGYRLVGTRRPLLGAVPVLLVVVAAVLCGSTVLYLLVRRYERFLRRVGRFFHLYERRMKRMESWIRDHGAVVIIPARLIPGLRIPTTVVSGTFGVSLPVFLPSVAVSALIWGAFYLGIGVAGRTIIEAGQDVLQATVSEWFLPAIVAVVVMAFLLHLWQPWTGARQRRKKAPEDSPEVR